MLKLVEPTAGATYRELGLQKLAALLEGLGLAEALGSATDLFERLTASFAGRQVSALPELASALTSDGTPFALSVAFAGERPTVGVLSEAQGTSCDVEAKWKAGLALTRSLAGLPGVDLAPFERVAALFAPPSGSSARFALFHAGALRADGTLAFKTYLNPRLVGPELAREIVREALVRLGADYAWEELEPKLGRTSELAYFSLDLASEGRVKVYVAHPGATAADIDQVVRDTSGYHPGLAQRWIEELTGSPGPFEARPILTSHAFRSPLHASEVTVHVPAQSYVANDAQAIQRVAQLLGPEARRLRGGVGGMAGRPLELGRGLVATVALRPVPNGTRLTTTLAPEAHAIATPRRASFASEQTPAPATEPAELGLTGGDELVESAPASGQCFDLVLRFIARSATLFSTHPLLERLEGEGSCSELRVLAPRFACYLLWHEDLLRRGALLTTEPEVRTFASACEAHTLAHKHELLNELAELGTESSLAWTFAPEHAAARDASYEIASILANATSDVARLAVLRALEAGGGEFLVRAVAYFERLGRSAGVGTFAQVHELLERDHQVLDAAAQSRLEVLPVPDRVMHEVFMAVERTFEAIGRLCDAIEAKMPDAALPGGLRAAG